MDGYKHRKRCPSLGRCISITTLALLIAITTMFIILLAGGLETKGTMDIMKSVMNKMYGQIKDTVDSGSGVANLLKEKFPANQPEVSLRQIIGTLENANKISARSEYLLNSVEPEAFGTTVKNINKIIGTVSTEDINAISKHALSIVSQVDNILSQVKPEKVDKLLDVIGKIDTVALNALIAMVTNVHEIKIQI
jgi:hypothetical protein